MTTQRIDRESLDAVVCGIFQRLGLDSGTCPPRPADYLHEAVILPYKEDLEYVEALPSYDIVHIVSAVLIPAVVAAAENPLNVDLGPVKAALAEARKEITRLRSANAKRRKVA